MNLEERSQHQEPPKRHFVIKTEEPTTYWIVMPIPLFNSMSDQDHKPGPPNLGILVMATGICFQIRIVSGPPALGGHNTFGDSVFRGLVVSHGPLSGQPHQRNGRKSRRKSPKGVFKFGSNKPIKMRSGAWVTP